MFKIVGMDIVSFRETKLMVKWNNKCYINIENLNDYDNVEYFDKRFGGKNYP